MLVKCMVQTCRHQENNICKLNEIIISESSYHSCDSYSYDRYKAKECINCKCHETDYNDRRYFTCTKFNSSTNDDRFNECWESE